MPRYRTQEQIDAWRSQSGFRTTSSVIQAEKEARTREVSPEEADRLLKNAEANSDSGGGSKIDRIVSLLERIEQGLQNLGTLG